MHTNSSENQLSMYSYPKDLNSLINPLYNAECGDSVVEDPADTPNNNMNQSFSPTSDGCPQSAGSQIPIFCEFHQDSNSNAHPQMTYHVSDSESMVVPTGYDVESFDNSDNTTIFTELKCPERQPQHTLEYIQMDSVSIGTAESNPEGSLCEGSIGQMYKYHTQDHQYTSDVRVTDTDSFEIPDLATAVFEPVDVKKIPLSEFIKEDLNLKIRSRRMSRGLSEVKPEYKEIIKHEMSDEEKLRLTELRRRNRVAAKKSREKKKGQQNKLQTKADQLEKENRQLRKSIKQTNEELAKLKRMWLDHSNICTMKS